MEALLFFLNLQALYSMPLINYVYNVGSEFRKNSIPHKTKHVAL